MSRSTNNVVSPLFIDVDDAVLAAGVVIEHPYPSHLKLRAVGLTKSGVLSVTFQGGAPEDGEELTITVQQSNIKTESLIFLLDFPLITSPTTPGFLNQSDTDQYSVSPIHGHQTIFRLQASISLAGTPRYNLLSSTCHADLPADFGYEVTTGVSGGGEHPQQSRTALRGPWLKQFTNASTEFGGQHSNPVWANRTSDNLKGGMLIWVLISGGDLFVMHRQTNGQIMALDAGAIGGALTSGTGSSLAIRDAGLTAPSQIWLYIETTTDTYVLKVETETGSKELKLISLAVGSPTGGADGGLLTRPNDDSVYFSESNNFRKRDASLGSDTVVRVLNGTFLDAAKTPDGDLAILTTAFFYVGKRANGDAYQSGDFVETTHNITGPKALTWDRLAQKWVVLAFDSEVKIHTSDDLDAGSWSAGTNMFTGATLPTRLISVGNAIIATRFGNLHTFISYDGGATFEVWGGNPGVSESDRLEAPTGFMAANGHLFAVVFVSAAEDTYLLMSAKEVGAWSSLDNDK